MLRLFGNNNISPFPDKQTVVTIGMFDGVHLGHIKVIQDVVANAKENNMASIAITFDVHPRKILGNAPALICSLEHRLQLLSHLGLDAVWVISFTEEFSKVTAREFTNDYLINRLSASTVILGENGNFGYKGKGCISFLQKNYPTIKPICVPRVIIKGTPVSSSEIRNNTSNGDLAASRKLLGRAPSVLGKVIKGKQIGRTIGFPTLNLNPDHELFPPDGVYATFTRCGDSFFKSITNIGTCPTINQTIGSLRNIESHLFNFSGNLYDHTAEVFFIEKIRDEKKFSGLTELKDQISNDKNKAETILAKSTHTDNITC